MTQSRVRIASQNSGDRHGRRRATWSDVHCVKIIFLAVERADWRRKQSDTEGTGWGMDGIFRIWGRTWKEVLGLGRKH